MGAKHLLCGVAVFAASCTTGPSREASAPVLPSATELTDHVREHWSDWGERFGRFSGRQGEAAELLSVTDASCVYRYDTPECWMVVTGRFKDGEIVKQRMFSQFERDAAGHLVEVIVMFERRS